MRHLGLPRVDFALLHRNVLAPVIQSLQCSMTGLLVVWPLNDVLEKCCYCMELWHDGVKVRMLDWRLSQPFYSHGVIMSELFIVEPLLASRIICYWGSGDDAVWLERL